MKRCDRCNVALETLERMSGRCVHCCEQQLHVNWRRMRPEEKFVLAESARAIVATGGIR